MTVDATPPPPPAQPPPPHLPPPELPPSLVAEYLESARSQLGVLAGLDEPLGEPRQHAEVGARTARSEERRVGKEWRSRGARAHETRVLGARDERPRES